MEKKATKKALDGQAFEGFRMDPMALTLIGIDTKDGREHALFDERVRLPLNGEMIANVALYGIIEPVIVRKNGDLVEVMDGRQRVRWARAVNAARAKKNKGLPEAQQIPLKVPVIIQRGEADRMAGVMVTLNEVRQEDSPLVRARKAQRLIELGMAEGEIAVTFGTTVQRLKSILSLLDLDPQVQAMVTDNDLSMSGALKLAGLRREEQVEAAKAMLESGQTSAETASRVALAIVAARPEVVLAPAESALTEVVEVVEGRLENKVRGGSKPRTAKETAKEAVTLTYVPPSKSAVKKLARAVGNGTATLSPDAVKILRWISGDLEPRYVGGLLKALRAAGVIKDEQTEGEE